MAFQSLCSTRPFSCLSIARIRQHSMYALPPFFTQLLEYSSSQPQPQPQPPLPSEVSNLDVDEHFVLNELADLLPVVCHSRRTIPNEARAADGFLLPEEKLRGVFLQRLRGKTAIESALSNSRVDLDVEILANVVNRGNLGGEAMVTFFNWAIKQSTVPNNVDSYRIIIKALGRRKFFGFMMQVLHDMIAKGVDADLELLYIVIDSFVRARQILKAIQIFRNIEDDIGLKCDTDSLNVLLKCICRRSHVRAANAVLNSNRGKIPFSTATYNAVIGGWAKYGVVSEAEKILKLMLVDGFSPDCTTFTYLIEALGRAGRLDDAVAIFQNMTDKFCTPETATYNAMIVNFISAGDMATCIRYYNEMLSNNCDPDIDTYTRLIVALLKARRVSDALEMFDNMLIRKVIPPMGTINVFMMLLCSYGPPYAALMMYKKVRKNGCQISLDSYKLLLMRLSRFGKCGMLLSIWEEMEDCGYNADMEVYDYVIGGLCNIGQVENAVLVMEEALQKGFCPDRLTYSKLRNKLFAANKTETAYKLFKKVKAARISENARRYWRSKGWHF